MRTHHDRRVGVWAADAITAAGIMAMLPLVGFEPVLAADPRSIDALLVATDSDGDEAAQMLTAAAQAQGVPVVWLHRRHATAAWPDSTRPGVSIMCPEEISVHEIGQALLAALLSQLDPSPTGPPPAAPAETVPSACGPSGSDRSALTSIERDALRLLAEGQDTAEIATSLFYSERTVKNAISRAVHKLDALNRSSAVATALRRGYL